MTTADTTDLPPSTDQQGTVALVVLAAGAGTRMRSALPKPLHPVAGVPMARLVVEAGMAARPTSVTLVVSAQTATNIDALAIDATVQTVVQDPPRGTGEAVALALDTTGDARWIVVLFADHPLLTPETVARFVAGAQAQQALVTVLTCILPDGAAYGRIARNQQGQPLRVVERKDDDQALRTGAVEVNSGMMVFEATWLRGAVTRLQPSLATGEFYMTDLVELAVADGSPTAGAWPVATVAADPEVALGINDRVQLAAADDIARERIRRRHMTAGVTIVAPETVFIDAGVTIGQDTTIHPFSLIQTGTEIGERCVVGPHTVLSRARLGDEVVIRSSTITDSTVASGADVGPYAHLRGNSSVGPGAHIGNFAEINRSFVGEGVKMAHFSYLGDAQVGARSNIGAGAITCNFDGSRKNRTEIGTDVSIGSDTMLVAPIAIGAGARTGAGSVVTKSVPPGATVVGVPARVIRTQSTSPDDSDGEEDRQG
ncbi:MAG: bifunctional UDP-N-acetylglucosamine diphosphorylase/glucosamine-1-phosphate N-acetyltransferase GlmU [Thermomicrobiales bacterium]